MLIEFPELALPDSMLFAQTVNNQMSFQSFDKNDVAGMKLFDAAVTQEVEQQMVNPDIVPEFTLQKYPR